MAKQIVDVALLTALTVGPLGVSRLIGPRTQGSKSALYRWMTLVLIVLGAGSALAWLSGGRPLSEMGFVVDSDPRYFASLATAFLFVAYVVVFNLRVAGSKRGVILRRRLKAVRALLPVTTRELVWFIVLGLVAGLSEEVAYRGYVLVGLTPGGPAVALGLSTSLFGLSHLYQGLSGATRSAVFGLALGILTLLAGSIIPAFIVHAAQDVGAGVTGYRLQGVPREKPSQLPEADRNHRILETPASEDKHE